MTALAGFWIGLIAGAVLALLMMCFVQGADDDE
jgi:hypothetical protein